MGNWIPNDPTFVAQLLRISTKYAPPPPEGFISPMTWGIESEVMERFTQAGIPKENVSFSRETFVFRYAGSPAEYLDEFRNYYGPTMNAYEAAESAGRAEELHAELTELIHAMNTSSDPSHTIIPATYLRVTVQC